MSHAGHAELEEAPAACQNCGAALGGPYCGFCGQKALRLDVSLRELAAEGLEELVHLDTRILATLRLLFTRPGRLTAEMLAGRRRRYIGPVRLYLVSSLVFFVVLAWLVPKPQAHTAKDIGLNDPAATQRFPFGAGEFHDRTFDARIKHGAVRVAAEPEVFLDHLWKRAPKAAFVMVPLFAFLTMAAFRRRVRFFVPHFYFALHFHSWAFLTLAALSLLGKLSPWIPAAGTLLLPPFYLLLAVRAPFEARLGESLWKSALVLGVYGFLLLTVVTTVLVFSVMAA